MSSRIENHVRIFSDGREICENTKPGRDVYKSRREAMSERQGGLCALCALPMRPYDTTFDHERTRGMGGANRDDRIEVDGVWQNAAVHFRCNADKGSQRREYVVTQYSVDK